MANVLVTGANRGIGLELVKQLAARGDQVIAVCRKASDELKATGVRVVDGVDVTDEAGVKKLAEAVSDTPLDLLINNAGILEVDSLDNLSFDSIQRQFQVNAMGPLRVTHALRGQLKSGSKVGIVTSRMGSIADNTSGRMYGYRMSKAAVNAAGVSLARELEGDGIQVVLLHPGWVKTEMTGNNGNCTADEAATGLIARIDELDAESSGSFVHANGEALPW